MIFFLTLNSNLSSTPPLTSWIELPREVIKIIFDTDVLDFDLKDVVVVIRDFTGQV